MAALFPEGPQISSTGEEYSFSHMTAAATEIDSTFHRGFCSIAIDSNTGKIYVVDDHPSVTIFSDTLEFLITFTLENVASPEGVVIYNDSMYMIDIVRHSVLHFKMTGNSLVLINEEGGEGSDIDHYINPTKLDVSLNGYIYVSDCYNHRIKVIDEDLYYMRQISHRSMTRPIDVKLNPFEVYVLCVSNTLTIHVFSHFGDKIQSLILRESHPEAWVEYSRFSLNSRGNFVITDSLSDIQIFSKEGKLIHTLGSHELGLESLGFDAQFITAQTVNAKLLVVSSENIRSSKTITFCCCMSYFCIKVRLFSL